MSEEAEQTIFITAPRRFGEAGPTGILTPADERFGEFPVWRDSKGNGKSEKNELFTLADLGIVSIGLERRDINALKPDDEGNQILGTSVVSTTRSRKSLRANP